MLEIPFIPDSEFERVRSLKAKGHARLEIIAEMCRLNTLSAVKLAGSGHLGSSLSSIEMMVWLYFSEMNVLEEGLESPDRDCFFSSKGHDCPGQYSVLAGAGILGLERLKKLRRLGGLDGHPDVKIPGMEVNSGSLGMGISKGKGIAVAKRLNRNGGRVFVMTGDGELQEGQIWESLQTAAHQGVTNLTAIVDLNRIQTDRPVKDVISLGELKKKFAIFGWHAEVCDGHDFSSIEKAFKKLARIKDRPKALIAETVKGKGVSFMEGPKALKNGKGLYRWHSGAPADEFFEAGHAEILKRLNKRLKAAGLKPVTLDTTEKRERNRVKLKDTAEKVVAAYGEELLALGKEHKNMVVLDADLSADCGLRPFEAAFPKRFIENGIAEQDMVSTAGGLALHGLLPVVNSFGVFLSSRANEQIYNNATEGTKIIYVCHYSGLIPAGPGKSHQSLRDISLFGALPNCTIIEPGNAAETKAAIRWCVEEAQENCMMRLAISPSPRAIELPKGYEFTPGRGTVLKNGKDAVLFAYGPVMLNEALKAAETLEKEGFTLKVVDMPWLNRTDVEWIEGVTEGIDNIFVLDNHSGFGGLGDSLLNAASGSAKLKAKSIEKFAIDEYPACGTPQEALSYHRVDGKSIAERIAGKTR